MLRVLLALCVLMSPAAAAEMRCDTLGVAQLIIPDLFAQNPGAKKLGLHVTDVRLFGVLPAPESDTCLVEVVTDHGITLKYKFRFDGNGVAILDMVPAQADDSVTIPKPRPAVEADDSAAARSCKAAFAAKKISGDLGPNPDEKGYIDWCKTNSQTVADSPPPAAAQPVGSVDVAKPPSISDSEEKAAIAKFKATWRAQDGETADEIILKAAKVAHFIPRTWEAGPLTDGNGKVLNGGRNSLTFNWAKHAADKADEEYSISWDTNEDGSYALSFRDKIFELGWQAFALTLIDNEIVEDDDGTANKGFLHNLSNLNFVNTSRGKLGDLLAKGRCALGDPVSVFYMDTWGREKPEKGDFWVLQLTVSCNIPGPRYFTHEGVVEFLKHGAAAWRPYSFFAHRIATYAPGSWFVASDPVERQAFDIAKRAGQDADNTDALVKVIELRNDGSMIHW